MRAIVQDTYGSAGVLQLRDIAVPSPAAARSWSGSARPAPTRACGT
jgi:hypothetical protein